jgi:L-iditol 2-dehydrogenase
VVPEFGAPLEVREVRVPKADPGALVVRVEVTTICGSDVHTWQGGVGNLPVEPPLILGHEIVGVVEEIGPGAERDSIGRELRVGDRVVWEHAACGHCRWCSVEHEPTLCPNRRVGMFHNCEQYPHTVGGFAEYSYVWPRAGRLRVPDDVESIWAAAASCALRTIMHAFERMGRIDTLSTVLIQGSGPLGLFATAVAAVQEPARLIVVGAPEQRLALARAWGAETTISIEEFPDRDARIARVRELTDDGADVLFEVSGAPGAFSEGVEMAGRGARYCVVGTLGGPPQSVQVPRITARELNVLGSLSGDIGTYYQALEFLRRYRDRFDWAQLFSDPFGLEDATQALEQLRTMAEIKPAIVPSL